MKVQDGTLSQDLVIRAPTSEYSRFIILLHYMSDQIQEHFGNGSKYDAKFEYVDEPQPLGTTGGLRLLQDKVLADQLVVVNSDVRSDFELGELLDFHVNNRASMTLSLGINIIQNPVGVLEVTGGLVRGGYRKTDL